MKSIISCEHATNRLPSRFASLFHGKEEILSTHEAYDPGAAGLARRLAKHLQANVYLGTVSRLLIDLNRSVTNRRYLYSDYSRQLAQGEREMLLNKYYEPYRKKVEGELAGIIDQSTPVLHISIHSFSPVMKGRARQADIGLLYDPARNREMGIGTFLSEFLQGRVKSIKVRRNYPYQGKTDGFTAQMRKKYSDMFYAGIEIEMNQVLLLSGDNREKLKQAEDALVKGLQKILAAHDNYKSIAS